MCAVCQQSCRCLAGQDGEAACIVAQYITRGSLVLVVEGNEGRETGDTWPALASS